MNIKKTVKTKETKETIECVKCKKFKVIGSYYNSKSTFSVKGKAPICKVCIAKLVDINNMDTVYKMLKDLDVKYDLTCWKRAVESEKETFGRYLSMINSFPQHEGIGWTDNITDPKQEVDKNNENPSPDLEVSDELKDKWGEGYKPELYRLFEKKWSKLIDNYGEKTALHTEGLITYIRFRVQEEIATAGKELKGAKQWGDLAAAAAKDAKLNVSQLSKSDISGGVELISQLFEAVETEVGIIPLLPQLREQPYDDADMIIWSMVNYIRRLEEKPRVAYREIYNFYDEMIGEFCKQSGMNEEQIEDYKSKRNNVFRDMDSIYVEPLYEEGDDEE